MDAQLKSNLTSPKHWVRLVYMVLFAFFLYIAAFVMVGLVIVQFIFSLLTGGDNLKLRAFGHSLTTYIQQALMFLSFNSEFKPFPFADWPDAPARVKPPEEVVTPTVAATTTEAATPSPASKPEPASKSESASNADASVAASTKATADNNAAEEEPPLVDPEADKRLLS